MESSEHRERLIHILQMAYSGEKAAALAYAGHWRSVRNPEERKAIAQIEREEWEHREIIGVMLKELGSAPQNWREVMMGTIGSVIYFACFFSGWYLPMYFAGLLEHANVHEYLDAATHAAGFGNPDYEKTLLALSKVEEGHEAYFRERVQAQYLTPMMSRIFGWGNETLLESTDSSRR